MRSALTILAVGVFATLWLAVTASAQQVTLGTPFHTLNDSYFERMGVGFSGNYQGINFSVGSFQQAIPQFGGFQPGTGLQTAFAINGPKGQLNFAFDFSQGYRQSNVSQTPMVTLMNGQTGYFSDTSQTPFVISQIPVVGAFPPVTSFGAVMSPQQLANVSGIPLTSGNPRVQAMRQAAANAAANAAATGSQTGGATAAPAGQNAAGPLAASGKNAPPEPAAEDAGPAARLVAAQESTAGRAAPSVAEARRMHAQEEDAQQEELKALFERGLAAEEDGKPAVAKIYYQQVARRASGELKSRVQTKLDELRGTTPSH
jgi:hypothetical protein